MPIGADIEVRPSPYPTDAELDACLEPEAKMLWLRASRATDIPIEVLVAILAHEDLHDWLYREFGLEVAEAIDRMPTFTKELLRFYYAPRCLQPRQSPRASSREAT